VNNCLGDHCRSQSSKDRGCESNSPGQKQTRLHYQSTGSVPQNASTNSCRSAAEEHLRSLLGSRNICNDDMEQGDHNRKAATHKGEEEVQPNQPDGKHVRKPADEEGPSIFQKDTEHSDCQNKRMPVSICERCEWYRQNARNDD
jgi:hypothetical protein